MTSPNDRTCPICAKQIAPDYAPFCSRRCADVDLNRWLKGSYAIPAVENEDAAEGDGAGGDDREAG